MKRILLLTTLMTLTVSCNKQEIEQQIEERMSEDCNLRASFLKHEYMNCGYNLTYSNEALCKNNEELLDYTTNQLQSGELPCRR